MGFKRDESRGGNPGSCSGCWNPSHELISRGERANPRQDLETKAGSTLSKLQQKFSKIRISSSKIKTILRAAGEQSENGHFIWLVPRYVFGPTKASDLDDNVSTTAEDRGFETRI